LYLSYIISDESTVGAVVATGRSIYFLNRIYYVVKTQDEVSSCGLWSANLLITLLYTMTINISSQVTPYISYFIYINIIIINTYSFWNFAQYLPIDQGGTFIQKS